MKKTNLIIFIAALSAVAYAQNVGIGTTTPTNNLKLYGSSAI